MAITGGLAMLLKSFGVDPAELSAQVDAAREGTLQMVKHFDARLARIEAKQDALAAELGRADRGADRGGAGLEVRVNGGTGNSH